MSLQSGRGAQGPLGRRRHHRRFAVAAAAAEAEMMYDISRLELAVEYFTCKDVCVLEEGFVRWNADTDTFSYLHDNGKSVHLRATVQMANDAQNRNNVNLAASAAERTCRTIHLRPDPAHCLKNQVVGLLETLQYARSAFRVHVKPQESVFDAGRHCTRVRIYWHLHTNRNRLTPEAAAWMISHADSATLQRIDIDPNRDTVNTSSSSASRTDLCELVFPRRIVFSANVGGGSGGGDKDFSDRSSDEYETSSSAAAVGASSNNNPESAEKVVGEDFELSESSESSEVYVVAVNRQKLANAYRLSRDAHYPPSDAALAQLTIRSVYSLRRRCESATEQFALSHICAAFVAFLDNAIDVDALKPTEIDDKHEIASSLASSLASSISTNHSVYHKQALVLSAQQAELYLWLCRRGCTSGGFGSIRGSLGTAKEVRNSSNLICVRRTTALRVADTNWYYDCERKSLCYAQNWEKAGDTSVNSDDDPSSVPLLIAWRKGIDRRELRPAMLGERQSTSYVVRESGISFVGGAPATGKRTAVLAAVTFGDLGFGLRSLQISTALASTSSSSRFLYTSGNLSDILASSFGGEFHSRFSGSSSSICSALRSVRGERRVRDASSFALLKRVLPPALLASPLHVVFESIFGPRASASSNQQSSSPTMSRENVISALRCEATLLLCSRARVSSWLSAIATLNRGRLWRGRVSNWYHIVDSGGAVATSIASGAEDNQRILFRIVTVTTLDEYWQLQYADLFTCDIVLVAYQLLCELRAATCSYLTEFAAARHAKAFEGTVWMQCLKHHMNAEQRLSFTDVTGDTSICEHNVPFEAIEWRRLVVDDLPALYERCKDDDTADDEPALANNVDNNDHDFKRADFNCIDRFLGVVQTRSASICVQSSALLSASVRATFATLMRTGASSAMSQQRDQRERGHTRLLRDCARYLVADSNNAAKRNLLQQTRYLTFTSVEHQMACKVLLRMMCQVQELQRLQSVPLTSGNGPTMRFALQTPSGEQEDGTHATIAQLKPTYRYILHCAEQNMALVAVVGRNLGEQLAQRAARFLSQINVDYADADSQSVSLENASHPFHSMVERVSQREQQRQRQQQREAEEDGQVIVDNGQNRIDWGGHDVAWTRFVQDAFGAASQLANDESLRDRPSGYRVRAAEWQTVVRYNSATGVGLALVAHLVNSGSSDGAPTGENFCIRRIPVLLQRAESFVARHSNASVDMLTTIGDRHLCSFLMSLSRSLTTENRLASNSISRNAPESNRGELSAASGFARFVSNYAETGNEQSVIADVDSDEENELAFEDDDDVDNSDDNDDDDTAFDFDSDDDEDVTSEDEIDGETDSDDDEQSRLQNGEEPRQRQYLGAINDYMEFYQSLAPEVQRDNLGPSRLAPARSFDANQDDEDDEDGDEENDEQPSPIRHIVSAVINGERVHREHQSDLANRRTAIDAVEQVRSTNQALIDRYSTTIRSLNNERVQTARILIDTIRSLFSALWAHPCADVAAQMSEYATEFANLTTAFDASCAAGGTSLAELQAAVDRCYDFYVERIAQGVLAPRRLMMYNPPISVNISYVSGLVSKLRRDTRWLARDAAFVEKQQALLQQHVVALRRFADESRDGDDCPVCLCEMEGVRALYPCGHCCCWECHEQCNNDKHTVEAVDGEDDEGDAIGAAKRGLRCFSCRYVLQGEQAVVAIGAVSSDVSIGAAAINAVSSGDASMVGENVARVVAPSNNIAPSNSILPNNESVTPKLSPASAPNAATLQRRQDEQQVDDAWRNRVLSGSYNFVKCAPLLRFLVDLHPSKTASAATINNNSVPVRVVVFSQFAPLLDEVCAAFRKHVAAHNCDTSIYFNPTTESILNAQRWHPVVAPASQQTTDAVAASSSNVSSHHRKKRKRTAIKDESGVLLLADAPVPCNIVVFQHVDITHRCGPAYAPILALEDITHVVFVESLCPRLTNDARAVECARQIETALLSKISTRFSRYLLSVVRLVLNDSVDEFLHSHHLSA
jgi:hypothetical protein